MSLFTPDNLIAIGALATSVIALATSVISLRMQAKHNRLSVRPVPNYFVESGGLIKISLLNKGVGPLKVLTFSAIAADGELHKNLLGVLPDTKSVQVKYFTNHFERMSIESGEKIDILTFQPKGNSELDHEEYLKQIASLIQSSIKLKYTSIYEEVFPESTFKFDWLHDMFEFSDIKKIRPK